MFDFIKNFSSSHEAIGFEQLSFSNPTLIVSNHVSKNDVNILHSLLPNNVYFAIDEEEQHLYKETLKVRKHIIYNVHNPKTLLDVKKLIQAKHPVLIFPESKISTTGYFMKIYPDIAKIALDSDALIYPIIIFGREDNIYTPVKQVKIQLHAPFTLEKNARPEQQLLSQFQLALFKTRAKKNIQLFNELVDTAKIHGEKKVIIEETSNKFTFKTLLLATHIFSYKLKALLKNEQVIGTFLPTSGGNAITMFALFKLGKTPAALNFTMGEKTLLDCIQTANVKTIISAREFIKKGEFEPLIEALSKHVKILYLEDLKETVTTSEKVKALSDYKLGKKVNNSINEVILFTSGSESKPKGVILTHDNIYLNIQQMLSAIDFTIKDKMLNSLPMFHSFGLTAGTMLPILSGIPVFLYPAPTHYKIIPEIAYRSDSTVLLGTSTFFNMYAKNSNQFDFHKIRLAVVGAEKLKDEVFYTWSEKFGIRIIEGYGVTETSPVLSLNTDLYYKRHTVGKLIPAMDYRLEKVEGIEEGGILQVKGPNVMKGYLLFEKGFVPVGEWYDTGDIVTIDKEGFISIVGRKKRFAKIGGEMISLGHIEQVASDCFNSPDFAALAYPDKRKGEKVILLTTLASADLRELKKYAKTHKISPLMIPKEIFHINEIPLLGSGKTDYVTLQEIGKVKLEEEEAKSFIQKVQERRKHHDEHEADEDEE